MPKKNSANIVLFNNTLKATKDNLNYLKDFGTCGSNVKYKVRGFGWLTLSGKGKMYDYDYNNLPPWSSYYSLMESVVIEKGITTIGDNAFSGCVALEPETKSKFKNRFFESFPLTRYYQFSGCKNLATVIIPDTVVSIGKRSFQNCAKLASLKIPSSVNSIKDMAFSGCSSLTSLTYLGEHDPGTSSENVFAHCDKLEYVSVLDSYKDDYFCGKPVKHTLASGKCGQAVHWLLDKSTGILTISGEGSMTNYEFNEQIPWVSYKNLIKSVEIKEGVISIGRNAFSFCKNLTSVVIPGSVEFIGSDAFSNCDNLTSVTYFGKNDPGIFCNEIFNDCNNLASVAVSKNYNSNKFCNFPVAPSIDDLSLVAIVKNETPYIKEWIEFHKLVGIKKFYIYDNESTDNLKETLKDYIESGEVIYKYYPGTAVQYKAYQEAINDYKYKTKFMGFIDIDEFIIPVEEENVIDVIEDIMKNDKKIAGVGIDCLNYGSSGFIDKPEGLVTENYKYRATDNFLLNKQIKTICNPRNTIAMLNVHYLIYEDDYYFVSEEGEKVNDLDSQKLSYKKLRINHYFSKSKSEYIKKMNRGRATTKGKRDISEFYKRDKNDVYDYIMEKYVDKLKNNLKLNHSE